jgi:plastocyanin
MSFRINSDVLLGLGAVLLATVLLSVAASAAATGDVSGTITGKGLASSGDIVVSLTAPGLKITPPAKPADIDQKGMKFIPHVLPVVKGTTVEFLNSDPLGHNVFSPEGHYNLGTWPQGQMHAHTFLKPGVYTQLCRVHAEMAAYVVVLDTPYFAVTHPDGSFDIPNVAAGEYTLVAWSETLNEGKQKVTVVDGKPLKVQLTLSK